MTPRRVGSLFAVGAALLWGTSWVATGFAVREFSPIAVAAWRGIGTAGSLVALLVLVAAAGRRPTRSDDSGRVPRMAVPPLGGRLWRLIVLGALGGLGFVLGMSIAVEQSGAAAASFVAGVYPVMAAAWAPLVLRERPSWFAATGLGVCLVGAVLVGGIDPTGLRPDALAVGLGAAASFALYLLLARRWSTPWGLAPPIVTACGFAVLAAGAVPLALWQDPQALAPASAEPAGWLALAWLCLAAGVAANLLVLGSVRRLATHESSAYLMLSPLTAAVLATALLGEHLDAQQLAGAALVIAGIAMATVIDQRRGSGVAPSRDAATFGHT